MAIGLTGDDLRVADVWAVAIDRAPAALSDAAREKMRAARALVEIDRVAPEHVVLLGDAVALALRIRNAGAIFIGDDSPVATGDYATGGNHVLPTGGRARSTGGLGLEAFLKPITSQRLTHYGLELLRPVVEALAEVEGMPAHAEAVRRPG